MGYLAPSSSHEEACEEPLQQKGKVHTSNVPQREEGCPQGQPQGPLGKTPPSSRTASTVLTMLGASAAARHCFPSPAEATPVTSLLDRGQRTEGAHEEPRMSQCRAPREPAPTATGLWALGLVADRLGRAVCAATPGAPRPPSLSVCPCQARRQVPEQGRVRPTPAPRPHCSAEAMDLSTIFFSKVD